MKNIITGFIAIVSMAIVGCTKDNTAAISALNEDFAATMEVEQTRTSLGGGGGALWSDGDVVSIFKKSGYHQKYMVEAGGSSTATLKYADESAPHGQNLSRNYAVYPYSANHAIDEQGVLTLDLSPLAEQSHTEGSFDNMKAAMTAVSDDNNLSFFNALSTLRVKLCSDASSRWSKHALK